MTAISIIFLGLIMAISKPIKAIIVEDSGVTILSRIVGDDALPIVKADLTSITYKVFDLTSDDPSVIINSGTPNITTDIFDTLQTDARWTTDATGYNFKHTLPAVAFPDGNARYRVEYKFQPVSAQPLFLLADLSTTNLFGS